MVINPGLSVQTSVVLSRSLRGDAAADERVVALDVDVEAGHHAPGKVAMRTVDRVRNQRVVAGLAAREIHQRDGRLSARHHEGVARVLELRDAGAQFEHGRGA